MQKFQYIKINKLFKVESGKTQNLQDLDFGNTPFISSTEKNNGISAFINKEPTFEGGLITVSRNGSVAEAFYQPIPFCASLDDIRVLTPLDFNLNKYTALYICTLIKKEKFRYTYGRKFGTERIRDTELKLPINSEGNPDWVYIEKFIKSKTKNFSSIAKNALNGKFNINSLINKNYKINTSKWKTFKFGGEEGIFIIKNGYYNKKPEHTEKGDIPFIGASMMNNGVTDYYSIFDIENNHKDSKSAEHTLEKKIFSGNCITIANNGVGVGSAFYQKNNFTCTHDINILYLKNKEMNKYIALFICTLIRKEKYRWAYGRKWRPIRMPDSEIKLPVTKDGNPDWDFMENYIKSLPYSSTI